MENLLLIKEPSDLFKAPDMTNKAIDSKFEKMACLFCDSSGFGAPTERALTQDQAIKRMQELMNEHGDLYVALTGIGQFQVYVSVFKKKAA